MKNKYLVAGICFEIDFPNSFKDGIIHKQYKPFLISSSDTSSSDSTLIDISTSYSTLTDISSSDSTLIDISTSDSTLTDTKSQTEDIDFKLDVKEVEFTPEFKTICGRIIKKCNDESPYMWIFESTDEKTETKKYNFGFSSNNLSLDSILIDNILYINSRLIQSIKERDVSNAAMLLYTRYGALKNRLMIHASVIENDKNGYIFLGKSGTGKSTHSRLWLEHIPGSSLLNDDNPIVYFEDNKAYVSGSPWSGKTPCYKNKQIPLSGIVRLTQAKENTIKKEMPLNAYAGFLPSCSCIKWEKVSSNAISKTVENVISVVPVYSLSCLPDKDAAELCYQTIHK